MEGSTQRVIREAQAAAQQAEHSAHPQPDTEAALTAITAEAAELQDMRGKLQEQDLPLTTAEVERTIAGLGDIATRSFMAARQLGLHAIEQRLMSQARLAELLGVSTMTVSRWYNETTDETEQRRRPGVVMGKSREPSSEN